MSIKDTQLFRHFFFKKGLTSLAIFSKEVLPCFLLPLPSTPEWPQMVAPERKREEGKGEWTCMKFALF